MPRIRQIRKPNKSFLLRLCLAAFLAYAVMMLVDMQVSVASRRQQLDELTAKMETQRLTNKELERQLAMGVDDAYVERTARDRLDFVRPNEEVFIDISGS